MTGEVVQVEEGATGRAVVGTGGSDAVEQKRRRRGRAMVVVASELARLARS